MKEDNLMKNITTKNRPSSIMIYEKTRDGEMWYDVYSRLVKERVVFLSGEDGINSDDATALSATLLYLDHQSKTKPISIYINSPGGSVSDGLLTIYDTMQYISAPIKTVCMGEACSAGAVLLGAGTKGMRLAFENSTIMLHQLQISGIGGTQMEVERETERCKNLNNKILKIVALHTGQTLEKVKEDTKHDFYMTAEEAIAYGLIDGLVKKSKTLPMKKVANKKKA
jgi:ATP-dependent Clp protease, protease subunit